MCQCICIPTHSEIKRAIRFMPWGEVVWFYYKNKIYTGELVGFETGVYGQDSIVKWWYVYQFEIVSNTPVKVDKIFFTENQALKWAMENTNLKSVLKNPKEDTNEH